LGLRAARRRRTGAARAARRRQLDRRLTAITTAPARICYPF
jgi:hypothetical protein